MKSRKKVSRKKSAPHKTSSRRSRVRSKRRTKRGGMLRSARAVAGTLFYHDILPLLSRARLNIHLGREPTPDEYAITKENERYYGTILDIPVDDGTKESIKNLREELEHPVKGLDKAKMLYDKIITKLDEEKRKAGKGNKYPEFMIVGKEFTPSPSLSRIQFDSPIGFSQSTRKKEKYYKSLVNQPFSSPDTKRNSYYSSTNEKPMNLPSKSELSRRRSISESEHIDEPKTPTKILFTTETPMSSPHFRSPPPPDKITIHENPNPQFEVIYDDTDILKKLDFSNTQ